MSDFQLDRGCWERGCMAHDERDGNGVTISAEPKREWVGLTDEEMRALKQKSVDDGMTRIVTDFEYIRSIEAKLKEKNT
jgi:hypothetical protein